MSFHILDNLAILAILQGQSLADVARIIVERIKPDLQRVADGAKECEGCTEGYGSQRDHDCIRFAEMVERTADAEVDQLIPVIDECGGSGRYGNNWYEELCDRIKELVTQELE